MSARTSPEQINTTLEQALNAQIQRHKQDIEKTIRARGYRKQDDQAQCETRTATLAQGGKTSDEDKGEIFRAEQFFTCYADEGHMF